MAGHVGKWAAGFAILAGVSTLGMALAGPTAAPAHDDPPVPVRVVVIPCSRTAQTPADDTAPDYAATLHYDREATLSFRVPGRITALSARPGDRIAPGALVAAIDSSAYRAEVDRQAADAARLGREAHRLTGLASDGAAAPADADQAHDAARAAVAGLDAAHYDLASTRLVAPFAALVLSRTAETGETVGAGQAVVRVADRNAPFLAQVAIPAKVAARLTRGAAASVAVSGHAAPIAGTVWRIAGGADPASGLVTVDIRIAAAPDAPSGTTASVRFALAAPHGGPAATRIPAEALLDATADTAGVLVIDGSGHARRQTVRFLGFDDRFALVAGLVPGTRVITAGAGFVSVGQRVTVTGA